ASHKSIERQPAGPASAGPRSLVGRSRMTGMDQHWWQRSETVRGAVIAIVAAAVWTGGVRGLAQAPARGATPPAGRAGTPSSGRGAAAGQKPEANLAQLMRGVVYPSSNVVFAAQSELNFPPVKDPATSPNLLTSTYGGWQA